MRHKLTRVVLPSAAVILAGAGTVAAAAWPAGASTNGHASHARSVYVAPGGKAGAHDVSCQSAAFSSISAAVSAAASGSTVVVCGGTYHEGVTVSKSVSVMGQQHAEIDASGQINGVLVKAPNVTISGLTVTGATGEGILINSASHVTIEDNVVTQNDLGGLPTNPVPNNYAECQAQGGVPGDCGEGIHLMSSSDDIVTGNISTGNSGGILLSDETGPTAHNRITGNNVTSNLFDCGITVVGHSTSAAPNGVPAPKVAGVYDNLVSGNTLSGNGVEGEGAGVVLAAGLPGSAVYDNTVSHNTISGNGLAGVTVHSHVPGQFLNGNVVTGNVITVNNVVGDSDFAPHVDKSTTGVLVATVSPLSIKVSGNEIAGNDFGIWTTGPAMVNGAQDNVFAGDTTPVAQG